MSEESKRAIEEKYFGRPLSSNQERKLNDFRINTTNRIRNLLEEMSFDKTLPLIYVVTKMGGYGSSNVITVHVTHDGDAQAVFMQIDVVMKGEDGVLISFGDGVELLMRSGKTIVLRGVSFTADEDGIIRLVSFITAQIPVFLRLT